jgi:hypothetical protein
VRQVLSWRFVAALAALAGLVLLINLVFVDDDSIAEVATPSDPTTRRADLISIVLETQQSGFAMGPDGRTQGDLSMTLIDDRVARVFAGTPGDVTCPDISQFGGCALLAETLGDTIVWFALVPMGPSFTFELPAIDSLDGGWANLVNGWQVPYAPVIDRRCESPAESFGEFLRLVGPNHRSLYQLGAGEIIAVVC